MLVRSTFTGAIVMPQPIPPVRYVPPSFPNPYPDEPWENVADFTYDADLHLMRKIESVQQREGENAEFIVAADYPIRYKLDGVERRIVVPRGMLTDLSSVPRLGRIVVSQVGPHLEASIVHDFLYVAWQDVEGRGARARDREFTDKIMRAGMAAADVGAGQTWTIYQAVRLFGGSAYNKADEQRYIDLG